MKLDANGTEIRVIGDVINEEAYISLTDIAKYKNPDNAFIVVANWMRNHSTISFLGLWEQIHNPNFKPIEFDRFKAKSGDNAFTLTPQQWLIRMLQKQIFLIWLCLERQRRNGEMKKE